MKSFENYYRNFYETIGFPLTARAGMPSESLGIAENRLGAKIPAALRGYFLVAGNERRFNACHNRLLPPAKWRLDKQRLIFMEENQSVVWWGVSARNSRSIDPPVWQGVNDESIEWFPEHPKCSVFLAVMLHYQAVNGGYRFCASADAPDQSEYRFEKNGWTYYGMVNSLSAYSRRNQIVCFMPPDNLPFMQKWSVLAGAKTKRELQMIADEIGLTWS